MDLTINWLSLGPALVVLFALLVLDIIGGSLVAIVKKELSSTVSYFGLLKKVGIFVYIGVGMCFDLLLANYQDHIGLSEFRPPVTAAAVIALFYVYQEMISVTEKLKKLGLPLPPFVATILDRLRQAHGAGITLPEVRITHAEVKKIDSDIVKTPDQQLAEKVAAKRAARAESVLDEVAETTREVAEKTRENSAILKSIQEKGTP